MNTRNMIIGVVVLVALIAAFMVFGGGANILAPKPSPTPVAALIDYENLVTASGTLVPVKRATLSFRMAGQVQRVMVQAGDVVKAGDVLAQLDSTELAAGTAQTQAALALAQAGLDQLKAGASKEDVAAAQANLDLAHAQLAKVKAGASAEEMAIAKASMDRTTSALRDAQSEYDKIKNDPSAGMFPQSIAYQAASEQYRIAEARYQQVMKGASAEDIQIAQAGVAQAQANLDRVKAPTRPAELAAAQARVDQAQAALKQAQAMASSANLTAPFAGTIAVVNTHEGETVVPGVVVITLGDIKNLRLETDDLSESSIARVKLGQVVSVTFEALPGQTFPGKVSFIAPISSAKAGGTNYTIYVDFDRFDQALRWGMTGHIEINTKQ